MSSADPLPLLLLVTVTDPEFRAVCEAFADAGVTPRFSVKGANTYYDLGTHGHWRVTMVRSGQGSVQAGAAALTVNDAILDLQPRAALMVGYAFGYPARAQVGDVLVAEYVRDYEPQRVGAADAVARGGRNQSTAWVFNACREAASAWAGEEGHRAKCGTLLSGEKLVANEGFRDKLLLVEPEALGGEMEGAGFHAACLRRETPWCMVKAVADYGDPQHSTPEAKEQAARNAAAFARLVVEAHLPSPGAACGALGRAARVPAGWGPPTGPGWKQPGVKVGDYTAGPDDTVMWWVPPGSFPQGSDHGYENERPRHIASVPDGFWIAEHPVTNQQYADFLNEAHRDPAFIAEEWLAFETLDSEITYDGQRYVPLPGRERHPLVAVTWEGAHQYAEHYDLALPTETDWEYAARGPFAWYERLGWGKRYPWGRFWDARKCCNRHNHAPDGRTLPFGSLPAGASWCNAQDMVGSVFEWCADWYGPYDPSSPGGPPVGDHRVTRGGSWYYDRMECRVTCRHAPVPTLTNNSLGFRCIGRPASEGPPLATLSVPRGPDQGPNPCLTSSASKAAHA